MTALTSPSNDTSDAANRTIGRLFLRFMICTSVAVVFVCTPSVAAGQSIDWKVKDGFRLIDYAKSKSTWSIPPGVKAFDFITQRMATRDRNLLPPFRDTHYKNAATLLFSKDYVYPERHWVTAWLDTKLEGVCQWEYQGRRGEASCSAPYDFEAITQFGNGDGILSVIHVSTGRRIADAEVIVIDRLVLGLGDSFASGQGNPDRPTVASSQAMKGLAAANRDRITNGRWMKASAGRWIESSAEWFDAQCHRSLFSQHVLASMRLATENPKESVTLVPLACSGAEIMDGLLTPQKNPPGKKAPVSDSQVNLAIRELCRDQPAQLRSVVKQLRVGRSGSEDLRPFSQTMLRCEKGKLRQPDAIFLSVGGNDVGFAAAISWAAIPDGYRNIFGRAAVRIVEEIFPPVCPSDDDTTPRCRRNRPSANYRVNNWLPAYYQYLMDELTEAGLVAKPERVFLTAYPNPSLTEDGKLCDDSVSADVLEQMRSYLPYGSGARSWTLSITEREMAALSSGLIFPLASEMRRQAERHKWTFVDSHVSRMLGNGICSGYRRPDPDIPLYPHIRKGTWYPESPDQTWAYDVKRPRWFRNTNDSLLFQSVKKGVTNTNINGAFHPDFRAHALIADELFLAVNADWKNGH